MLPHHFSLNAAVTAVDAPPIPEAQGWRVLYDNRHGPLIDLSQAVPGSPPPPEMLERLAEAARAPDACRYGPILGDAELRAAYAASTSAVYGASIPEAAVAMTSGCNQAFVAAMMALAGAGDTVILPAPWYFNHRMTLDMLGITTRILPCRAEAGFLPDPDEAERLIDARTRAIVLVSPNNPTGAVLPAETIARFAVLARRRKIALVLDETYRDFLPEGQSRAHDLFLDPDWGKTLIQLYSFSKAYAIPGHRLGAMIGAPTFIHEITKILDCLHICPPRPAQRVVAWAIPALAAWRERQRQEINRRAQICRAALLEAPGWQLGSLGAYFAFVAHPFAGENALAVGRRLAEQGGVISLPGPYFGPGLEGHLRLAFANVGVDVLDGLAARLRGV